MPRRGVTAVWGGAAGTIPPPSGFWFTTAPRRDRSSGLAFAESRWWWGGQAKPPPNAPPGTGTPPQPRRGGFLANTHSSRRGGGCYLLLHSGPPLVRLSVHSPLPRLKMNLNQSAAGAVRYGVSPSLRVYVLFPPSAGSGPGGLSFLPPPAPPLFAPLPEKLPVPEPSRIEAEGFQPLPGEIPAPQANRRPQGCRTPAPGPPSVGGGRRRVGGRGLRLLRPFPLVPAFLP